MEILASVEYLNTLLHLKQDTQWEALRDVDTCRIIVHVLRKDEGFIMVWEKASIFARIHNMH